MVKVSNGQQGKFFKKQNIEFLKTITLTRPKISVEGNKFVSNEELLHVVSFMYWEFTKKRTESLTLIQTQENFFFVTQIMERSDI